LWYVDLEIKLENMGVVVEAAVEAVVVEAVVVEAVVEEEVVVEVVAVVVEAVVVEAVVVEAVAEAETLALVLPLHLWERPVVVSKNI
jgi:hypothetical protein